MSRSGYHFYIELYLRHVHRHGYPVDEERPAFNQEFYGVSTPEREARRNASAAISRIHHYVKNGRMPAWVMENPVLYRLWADVIADYRKKYDNKAAKPIQNTPVVIKTSPLPEDGQPDKREEEEEDEAIEPAEVDWRLMVDEPMSQEEDEDLIVVEEKIVNKGAPIVKEEETLDDIVQNALSRRRANSWKNVVVSEEIREKTAVSEGMCLDETMKESMENEEIEKKMEKETIEKEETILEWETKKEEGQKTAAGRIAQLEEELKAAQDKLARMAEKMELMEERIEMKDTLLRDKERTIQILTSPRN